MEERNSYNLVIDQSTSGSKLLLLKNEKIIKRYDKKHKQIFPEPGWVEHDPVEIIDNIYYLLEKMATDNLVSLDKIESISIANQRETVVAWDKETGDPLYNAIVWQCNRSQEICETLIEQGFEKTVNEKTGLKIDPYFSGTKIKWLYDEIPLIKEKSKQNRLAIGTIDSWIIWNLTNHQEFVTEPSNACRTLLYNINTNSWDEELLEIFGVKGSDLPKIKNSSGIFGLYGKIPIRGVLADSQAALFGQKCTETGNVKITMGTGCSIMMQLEQCNKYRDSRILTTIARKEDDKTYYALEGIIRSCGDSINWLNENIVHFENCEAACNQVLQAKSEEKVYFIPGLQGLGAPYWNNEISGSFLGIKRSTTKYDLLRSVLESIIFQVKKVLDVMEEVSEIKISNVKVDGGVTKNYPLISELATLLNKKIIMNDIEELSAIGAVKIIGSANCADNSVSSTIIEPSLEHTNIIQKYKEWEKMVDIF